MSLHVIGLDIGTYAIKAVLLRQSWRSSEVVGFFQKTIERDQGLSQSEATAVTLEKLFSENKLKSDEIVVALSGLSVSTRIITLPFTDRRKIARVVPFEVESHIPFGLEDVVISYHILRQEGGKTWLLAGAIRKEVLKEALETLTKGGVTPRIVDVDFMALFNLAQTGLRVQSGCYAIVDIGESKTSICLVRGGALGFGRSIPIGGRAISRALEKALGLSREESERLKETRGLLAVHEQNALEGEEKRIAVAVESAVVPLVQEIGRTFYAFEAETQAKVEEIFLCGGTARLTNIAAYFSEKMGIPVAPLPLPSSSGLRLAPGDEVIIAQAYGLGIRAVADGRCSQVNFLKDEFAYRTEIKGLKSKAVYVGVFLGIILGLFVFDGVQRYAAKKQRYAMLKQEIRRVFLETFPGTKLVGAEKQQMQSRILELQKESEALIALGGSPVTALDLIREVTERTPAGLDVDVVTFSFDAERLRLSGRTDSFESVDRLLKALRGYELFEDVVLSNAKVDVDDNKVDFKLSITLRSS